MLSFVIPTMNEREGINFVISEIKEKAAFDDYEILVVDTNSTDGTKEDAAKLGAVVLDEPRRGYGRAYKTGFSKAKGDIIITLDADGTYSLDNLESVICLLLERNLDFITRNRFGRKRMAMKFSHKLGNFVLSFFVRLLFKLKIEDSQSGMWIFKREILPKLELIADGMEFSEEIKIEAFKKTRSMEVPIFYRERIGKVKLSGLKDGFRNLKFLVRKKLA